MIKIMFEVSEDFIRESASTKTLTAKAEAGEDESVIEALFNMIGSKLLKRQIDNGKTEFVVTPDKLDDKSKDLYNKNIAVICSLAAFSETDNKKEESEE